MFTQTTKPSIGKLHFMNQFSHPISIPKQLHTFLSIAFSKKRVYISHKQGNKISENERTKRGRKKKTGIIFEGRNKNDALQHEVNFKSKQHTSQSNVSMPNSNPTVFSVHLQVCFLRNTIASTLGQVGRGPPDQFPSSRFSFPNWTAMCPTVIGQ